METYGTKSEKIQAKINDIDANIKSVEDSIKSLRSQKQNLEKDVATLNAQLAGVIVCPKCKHEFTLSDDVDIDGARKNYRTDKVRLRILTIQFPTITKHLTPVILTSHLSVH